MARNGNVARFTGKRRARIVPWPLLELRFTHALDDGIEESDLGYRQEADRLVHLGIRKC